MKTMIQLKNDGKQLQSKIIFQYDITSSKVSGTKKSHKKYRLRNKYITIEVGDSN